VRPKLSPALRGYGYAHRGVRAMLAPAAAVGMLICTRCGNRIEAGSRGTSITVTIGRAAGGSASVVQSWRADEAEEAGAVDVSSLVVPPRVYHVPEYDDSLGVETVEFAREVGWVWTAGRRRSCWLRITAAETSGRASRTAY
jgi:hypothetical protein